MRQADETTLPSAEADTPLNRRLVGWLSLAQLVSWGSLYYTFALLLQPIELELGLSRAESSLAFSLALLAEGLVAFPAGRWIDRGHERAVMTAGSLVAAAGLAFHSLVACTWSFYTVWAVLGVAMGTTLYTPAFAVVTRRYPAEFRRAIITLTFLGGLASTVFVPLTAWLMDAYGWRNALLILAAHHLALCAPLHAVLLRNAPAPAPRAPHAISPKQLLRSPPYLLILVFSVGMLGITAAVPPHLVSLLREGGLSPAWVIAVPASIGLLQVIGRVLLYCFERQFDVHIANRLIPWLIPLGMAALLAGASQPVAALAFVALFGIGNGMLTIVKGTAVALYVSRDHAASLNGAMGPVLAIARALAPLLLGVLWTPEAGYRWGLALLVVFGAGSAVAMWAAQRKALP